MDIVRTVLLPRAGRGQGFDRALPVDHPPDLQRPALSIIHGQNNQSGVPPPGTNQQFSPRGRGQNGIGSGRKAWQDNETEDNHNQSPSRENAPLFHFHPFFNPCPIVLQNTFPKKNAASRYTSAEGAHHNQSAFIRQ